MRRPIDHQNSSTACLAAVGATACRGFVRIWLWILLATIVLASPTWATEIVLKDGRLLQGKLGKVASLADSPQPNQPDGGGTLQLISFLDDELRRTFFSDRLVREVRQAGNQQLEEKFAIRQRVMRAGSSIKTVGQPLRVSPFDEYGRRIFTMAMGRGPLDVIQGITELTPQWTKVEGISQVWDMRMATSSIPADTLLKILLKQIDPKDIEGYKKIARFYLQCERYEEARQILEKLIASKPDNADLKKQLDPSLRAIKQLSAQRLLNELKLRRDAGQHQLVFKTLKQFPAEDVGGDILQGVREMIQDYDTREARRKDVVKHLKKLAERLEDTIHREKLTPILDEIAAEIGPNTLDRMAAFLQNADDAKMADARRSRWPSAAGYWRRCGNYETGHGDFGLQGSRNDSRLS